MKAAARDLGYTLLSQKLHSLGLLCNVSMTMATLALVIGGSSTSPSVEVSVGINCSRVKVTAIDLNYVFSVKSLHRLKNLLLESR